MAADTATKKELARMYYLRENFTQQEIAEKIGTTRVTVGRWVASGGWEQLKASVTVTRDEQLRRIYMQVAELNDVISRREIGQRYPTDNEAKKLNNLATAIDKMEREVGLGDIISVSQKVLTFARATSPQKAVEIAAVFDNYIKTLVR